MKIKDILNENQNNEQLFNAVKDFQHKYPDFTLYHGTGGNVDPYTLNKFHFRKGSKDTPQIINAIANQILKQSYGLPIRDLFYATQDHNTADAYGVLKVVVPVGDYTLYYAEGVEDFTAQFNAEDMPAFVADQIIDEIEELDDDITSEELNDVVSKYNREIFKIEYCRSLDEVKQVKESIKYETEHEKEIGDTFIELFISELYNTIETDISDDYNVHKIVGSEDIPPRETEIMCYMPDGFYLISPDMWDEFTEEIWD